MAIVCLTFQGFNMQSPKSPIRTLPNNSSRLGTGRCPLSWKCLSWLRASAIESSVPVSCNGLLGSWPASKLGCKNIRCGFCSRPLEENIYNNSIQKANIQRRWNVCGQRRQTNFDLPKRRTKCWSAAVQTWWYWHLMSPDTSWYGPLQFLNPLVDMCRIQGCLQVGSYFSQWNHLQQRSITYCMQLQIVPAHHKSPVFCFALCLGFVVFYDIFRSWWVMNTELDTKDRPGLLIWTEQ